MSPIWHETAISVRAGAHSQTIGSENPKTCREKGNSVSLTSHSPPGGNVKFLAPTLKPARNLIGSTVIERVGIGKLVTRVQLAEYRAPSVHSITTCANVVFAICVPTSDVHVQQIDLALSVVSREGLCRRPWTQRTPKTRPGTSPPPGATCSAPCPRPAPAIKV